jgi:5-methylcytosine-specific restriction protein A
VDVPASMPTLRPHAARTDRLMPTSTPRLCTRCRQPCRGRCPNCTPAQRHDTDQARGNSSQRGYGSHWRRTIRPAFLRDNPLCTICSALAEVPDHWPVTRKQLIERGVPDPDAAHRLRPLCLACHALYGPR